MLFMLILSIELALFSSQAFTEEERAQHFEIGKRYNIMYNKRERALEADLHRKIKLKAEAIAALPSELKEEALTIDPTPIPITRRIPTWTPPIPGFDANKFDLSRMP